MPSLLDRRTGATAQYTLQRLGRSPQGRVAALEAEVQVLRRVLAMDVRVPVGFELADARHQVNFNPHTGRARLFSSDDSVRARRNPNDAVDTIDLTTAGGGAGCPDAWSTVTPDSGGNIVASGCGQTLPVRGQVQCGTQLVTTQNNAGALEIGVCFPQCLAPGDFPVGTMKVCADIGMGPRCYAVRVYDCADV